MVRITNEEKFNNEIHFHSNTGEYLILTITENGASVTKIETADDVIYDALVKTAAAYSMRRGITFNKDNIKWTEPNCQ
ncbi:MAG: hypothetical protein FWD34_02205 [Oscillospiraceae bacterium]|nr:hypothetical protein [Oscillospiraceae bacterium]